MKTCMIVFLIGFLLFGGIGLFFRLSHDWSSLTVETSKLSDDSIAKRDGRAMQLTHREAPSEEALAAAKKKADSRFRSQLLFSILSMLCLVGAVVCGALM